jgi:RNA polymerase sigma factor (sigma-70 family)
VIAENSEASSMPDSNNIHELQERVASSRDLIKKQVTFACRKYNPSPEKVKDLTSEIILFLLVEDCRHQKTYDPAKGKFGTWLQQVVNRYVSHHFQRTHPTEPLEDILINSLCFAPTQEYELLRKEQLALIYNEIEKLSHHNQGIAYLKLREVPSEEIARHLKIKIASVEREWRVIKTTLVHHLAVEWQSKGVIPGEKFCNIFNNFIRFLSVKTYMLYES